MPTLILQPDATVGKDTRLVFGSGSPRNYGVTTSILTGTSQCGLIWFDLSTIPASAKCVSATLGLYQMSSGAAQAFTVTAYSIAAANAAWIEGTGNGTVDAAAGEPCWDGRVADGIGGVTTPWAGSGGLATAGTDYETTVLGTVSGDKSDANGTLYALTLLASRVQEWFGSPNTNYGLKLVSNASLGGLAASDNVTVALRPTFTLVYTLVGRNIAFVPAGVTLAALPAAGVVPVIQ